VGWVGELGFTGGRVLELGCGSVSLFHRDGAGHGLAAREVGAGRGASEAPGKTAIDQDQMPQPGASLLSYPASIPLSNRSLTELADLIRQRRNQQRSRWRRLDPGRQALLVLAHLRNGDSYARLAAGFAVATSTAWRYVREAVDLLAALADDVAAAGQRATRLAYAILDGTLVPIDRVADQKPYYSGCEDLGALPRRSV
jgi:hypothetical protein